jgi:hypothetical protein
VGGYAPDPVQKIEKRKLRNANVNLPIALFAQVGDFFNRSYAKFEKFCMKLMALMLAINYYAQSAFKKLDRKMTAYGYARVSTNGQNLSALKRLSL